MKQDKILYIVNSIIPSREANSINVMSMAGALYDLGHDVCVLTRKRKVEFKIENVNEYYGINSDVKIKKYKWFLPRFTFLGEILNTLFLIIFWKPNVVIGRSLFGCMASSLVGKKTVLDLHAPIWEESFIKKNLLILFLRLRSTRGVTCNSISLKKMCMSYFDKYSEMFHVAHNGAKDDVLSREALPGQSNFKVGYFGHLYSGRGIDLIIKVAQQLKSVDFIICGGNQDDITFWKLECSAMKNIFYIGFVPPSEVAGYRNSCDALLAPYQDKVGVARSGKDTSKFMNPIKVIEYLSSGKPIVASDMPAIREVLNENNSILVDNKASREWCDALTQLIQDPDYATKIGRNAREDFLSNYTWKHRAEKLLRLFSKDSI